MRKDQQFVQNQLIPFLRGIMTDAKESGKSFYKYFGAEKQNKTAFTNSKELYRYKYGANSLFESNAEAEKGFEVLTDELFAKMQREFHYGTHKMYLPDENGKFSERQEEALFKLSGNLIEKVNFKEKQTPQEKAENNEKTIKETSQRLGLARVNIAEPLHLNPETGLIEGKIININDPTGSYLTVKIDPVDPELIYFEDDSGRISFTLNNSDRDILLFQGRDSRGVMNMAGYKDTENGIPQKMESDVGQSYEIPKAKTPQEEKLEMELSLKEENKLEIEEVTTEEEGRPNQPNQIKIKAGIRVAAGQGERPVYAKAGGEPVRVTEKGLLELEERELRKKAGITKRKQQPQENAAQSMPKTEEGEPEEERDQKKKGSMVKKILIASVTGGVIVGGGIVGAISTGLI